MKNLFQKSVITIFALFASFSVYGQFVENPTGTLKTTDKVVIGNVPSDGSLTVGGGVNIGGAGNAHLKVRHINGKHHQSTGYGPLYLNWNIEQPIIVGRPNAAKKTNLYVTGFIKVGNAATPAGYKMYVEDGILTEKVKVALRNTTDWADYVFEEDYDLNSIEEVEDFVKENKHLPNIPSAAEVVDKGLNVAEMDAKLLRQIEELWLQMIELNKEVKGLKAESKALKGGE